MAPVSLPPPYAASPSESHEFTVYLPGCNTHCSWRLWASSCSSKDKICISRTPLRVLSSVSPSSYPPRGPSFSSLILESIRADQDLAFLQSVCQPSADSASYAQSSGTSICLSKDRKDSYWNWLKRHLISWTLKKMHLEALLATFTENAISIFSDAIETLMNWFQI